MDNLVQTRVGDPVTGGIMILLAISVFRLVIAEPLHFDPQRLWNRLRLVF